MMAKGTVRAWVALMLAALLLPRERWTAATTLTPVANMSDTPRPRRKMGAAMFTAAKALLPTPCPTKMPSARVSMALNTNPKRVGTKSLMNNWGMFILPKSMLSLLSM